MDYIIDTHMHLQDQAFEGSRDEVVRNALKRGVRKLIVNATSMDDILACIELSEKYESVYLALGIHPLDIDKDVDLKFLESLLKTPKVVAIGEIGLDYHYTKENKNEQIALFDKQIKLAKKYHLPAIIHVRDAFFDTLKVLEENAFYNCLMHCYSGSVETAKQLTSKGALLGIGGVVTFKSAKTLKEVVKMISLDHLVLETDSPYLSPEPFRGKRNEPQNLVYVIEEISKIKELSFEKVVNTTTKNAIKIFNFKEEK